MFDVERAITEWRQRIIAAGVKTEEILSELESHLRDDIEQQTRAGLTLQQAFVKAISPGLQRHRAS